ncbi:MAG: carboxypeptidase-like regulatory domain-containing protein, partial [Tenacibaculum sp.]
MKQIILFCCFFTVLTSYSQTGNIQGIISDRNGLPVPGANIIIESINRGTVSDFDGKFTLVNISENNYTILVKYLGYNDIRKEITVHADKTTSIALVLQTQNTELAEIEVKAYALGSQAKSLNTQKNKQNISNIVSTDQIGKFPDSNIGDAVKRIPGISMQVDQGEARNIIIRGLSPQLNSITLNGSRIPSAEGDNRNVQMDLIPADMIQTVEVNKALTPDMDADALGGSVNLITRATPRSFRLSTTLGSGLNFITNKRILKGSFLVGDRTKNKKLGWLLSASINDNDFGSDNIEAQWTRDFKYNTKTKDENGKDIIEKQNVNPYADEFEIRKYLVQRIRRSFAANIDYKLNKSNTLYFKSMYNWRDDRENRFRLKHKIIKAKNIKITDFDIDAANNLTRFPIEAQRQTKGGTDNNRNKNTRLEDQRMQSYSLAGQHLIKNVQIDWAGSFSRASEERPNERYIEYQKPYSIFFNGNEKKPNFLPVSSTEADYKNFELNEITEENQYTKEKDLNIFVNAQFPVSWIKKSEGFLKLGIKTKLKNKSRNNDFDEYKTQNSDFDILEMQATRNYTDDNFLVGNNYKAGVFITPELLGRLDLSNNLIFKKEDLPEEYLGANFEVNENVYAAYAMTQQQLTSKLRVLAGLRIEYTDIKSTGNELVFDTDGDFSTSRELKDENNYKNILPSIHLKYDIAQNTVLRLAWS